MGFDAVATSAEECKCPSRDLPIGIISSIVICMTLYIAVSLSLTAAINYTQLDTPEPVAYALRLLGWPGMANLIAVGVLAGIITTLIVYLFGQSRVFFAVSRDGMLPQALQDSSDLPHTVFDHHLGFHPHRRHFRLRPAHAHRRIVQYRDLGRLPVNLIGIVVMRRKHPEIPRKFHCPLLYLIAPVGIIVCFYLIYELSTLTHILFAGWILLGLIVYYAYSRKHSIVRE